jgi:5-methylcytosine-specific restriction endonuclease McrA
MMQNLEQLGLRTDVSGMPIDWISYRDAVRLYHADLVVYSLGTVLYRIRGGINALTGKQSVIEVSSIIATQSDQHARMKSDRSYVPPLSNDALFARDDMMCMYCGDSPPQRLLSRDHVTPLSRGGRDQWANVVTACKHCNNQKAGRTPEEARMSLLAVPFVPTHAEYVYLRGRRVLADQMEFLAAHFPRSSPLRARLSGLN